MTPVGWFSVGIFLVAFSGAIFLWHFCIKLYIMRARFGYALSRWFKALLAVLALYDPNVWDVGKAVINS